MQKYFPVMFAAPVPLNLTENCSFTMLQELRRMGVTKVNDTKIKLYHIRSFLACWKSRREYCLAASKSKICINHLGEKASTLSDMQREEFKTRYINICLKQKIEE